MEAEHVAAAGLQILASHVRGGGGRDRERERAVACEDKLDTKAPASIESFC